MGWGGRGAKKKIHIRHVTFKKEKIILSEEHFVDCDVICCGATVLIFRGLSSSLHESENRAGGGGKAGPRFFKCLC